MMSDNLETSDNVIAPVPRVTIQAFCETPDVATAIQSAAADRRMNKTQVKIQMGGASAAVEAYRHSPTPNILILEANSERDNMIQHLDSLSEVCDAGTKVLVIGHTNDVLLYRELTRRGVSDYLIAPIVVLDLVRTISDLFAVPGAPPIGRTVAVIGAKGGVGASTLAHNLSWAFAKDLLISTVIVDLDIAFGTAGLDFNQDPPQGVAEAIFAPDRIDAGLIDRLMSKCSENLNLLAAPATLDRTCDLNETAIDSLIDILRTSIPCIVLDIPHLWTAWARRTLIGADDIIIVCEPELASLRNAKNLLDLLKQARPNDKIPKVVLNQVGVPKRPEIAPAEFAKAIGIELSGIIPYEAQLFGTAANNGQMIAEILANGKVTESFVELARVISGRAEQKRVRTNLLDPIKARLLRLKAS
jgi:pilus assembly protein CpaE